MKKLNLDTIFHDAVEYDPSMSYGEIKLLDRKMLEFELDNLEEELVDLWFKQDVSESDIEYEKKLKSFLIDARASLLLKAWNEA